MLKRIFILLWGASVLFPSASAAVSCNFSVSTNESANNSLNGWKFWEELPSKFYSINVTITGAPGNYAILFVKPTGETVDVKTNQSTSTNSFYFSLSKGFTEPGGGYRFRVIKQYVPSDIWGESSTFYIGPLPTLNVSINPSPMLVDEEATVYNGLGNLDRYIRYWYNETI